MLNEISDRVPALEEHLKKIHKEACHLVDTPSSSININETSRQLEAIKNDLNELSESNGARVLYFKAEIALGNYQIDSDKIAQKMLQEPLIVD